jgi:aryl-alcohol dehydrogenase-like predicted oxidoreductase
VEVLTVEDEAMERRSFLKAGLASGVLAAGGTAAAVQAAESTPSGIPMRRLGKTGLHMPLLGSGGASYGDNHATVFGVFTPEFDDRVAMVRTAYDKGVRFFDTARIYGDSEAVTGKALGAVRGDVFINSKVMVNEPRQVRGSVERSLEELGMDYVDSMMLHGPIVERLEFETLMGLHAELDKMRDEGMIRHIGLSGHSRFEKMLELIDTEAFDTLLIQHGYMRKGFNTRHSLEQAELQEMCLARAHELDMGIIAMKIMGAIVFGHNAKNLVPDFDEAERAKLPGAAIRWALQDERIQVMILGLSLAGDLDANIATLQGDHTLTSDDRRLLASFAHEAYQAEPIQEMRIV